MISDAAHSRKQQQPNNGCKFAARALSHEIHDPLDNISSIDYGMKFSKEFV